MPTRKASVRGPSPAGCSLVQKPLQDWQTTAASGSRRISATRRTAGCASRQADDYGLPQKPSSEVACLLNLTREIQIINFSSRSTEHASYMKLNSREGECDLLILSIPHQAWTSTIRKTKP